MRRFFAPLLALLAWGASPSFAEEEPGAIALGLQAPVVDAIVVDGRLDEPAWAGARSMPAAALDVPDPPGDTPTRSVEPTLHAVVQDGQLCLGVSCNEPPGTGCGLLVFVARQDADSAGHAWSLAYRPLNPRVDRYIVRTAKGVGRTHCPMVGAIDVSQADRWTLELRVPLAEVGAQPTDALRIAAAVCTRTPTLVAASPPTAAWRGPANWFLLAAPSGGWKNDAVPSAEALAVEAQTEAAGATHWHAFFQGTHEPLGGMRQADDPALLEPARRLLEARADLLPVIQSLLGDLYERVGDLASARKAYDTALSAAPGWSEARMGRDVRLRARQVLSTPAASGAPTDYAAAFEQVASARAQSDAWDRQGWAFVEGLLRLRACEFPTAVQLLEPIAERYPGEEWPNARLERARKEVQDHALEMLQRKREVAESLPRAKLTTTRGDIVVELFEKNSPNAVNQFVWLAEKGFYDGTRVHHAVPFSHAALGDPFSKDEATLAKAGLGGPGYEVPLRRSPRRSYRGSIAFPLPERQVHTAGSNFVLLTGLATDADGLASFGAIVQGQAVADALRAGDRVERVTVLRKTPDWSYHPVGMDGKPVSGPK